MARAHTHQLSTAIHQNRMRGRFAPSKCDPELQENFHGLHASRFGTGKSDLGILKYQTSLWS